MQLVDLMDDFEFFNLSTFGRFNRGVQLVNSFNDFEFFRPSNLSSFQLCRGFNWSIWCMISDFSSFRPFNLSAQGSKLVDDLEEETLLGRTVDLLDDFECFRPFDLSTRG